MEYTQLSLTLEEYQQSKEEIKKELSGIAKSFIRTGWYLDRIDRSGAYKMDGYKSVAEFAKTEYNMTPSGVSRFIKVYNRYTVPGDTPELLPQYEGFNFSQLQEMMQIPETDHDMILPEAKKENIRELRRFNTENESNPDNLLDWKEEKESEVQQTIRSFFRTNCDLTKDIASSRYWKEKNIRELSDMVNPSGNRSYRAGKVFLMMYENSIRITEFGAGKQKMGWEEFFRIAEKVIEEAGNGADSHSGEPETTLGIHGTTEHEPEGDTGKDTGRTHDTGEEIAGTEGGITETAAGSGNRRAEEAILEPDGADRDSRSVEQPGQAKEAKEPEQSVPHESVHRQEEKKHPDKPTDKSTKRERMVQQTETAFVPSPEIAPAQQDETEHVEGIVEPQEETAFGSRWDYLKTKGKFAVALQLAVIVQEANYASLQKADFWDAWLSEEVDEDGESFQKLSEIVRSEQIEGQMTIDDITTEEGEECEPTAEKETGTETAE